MQQGLTGSYPGLAGSLTSSRHGKLVRQFVAKQYLNKSIISSGAGRFMCFSSGPVSFWARLFCLFRRPITQCECFQVPVSYLKALAQLTRLGQTPPAQGAKAPQRNGRRQMEGSHRTNEPLGSTDYPTIYLPAVASIGAGANVFEPLYILCHPAGYPLSFLWCFPARLRQRIWLRAMAKRSVVPRSLCWHGLCHPI